MLFKIASGQAHSRHLNKYSTCFYFKPMAKIVFLCLVFLPKIGCKTRTIFKHISETVRYLVVQSVLQISSCFLYEIRRSKLLTTSNGKSCQRTITQITLNASVKPFFECSVNGTQFRNIVFKASSIWHENTNISQNTGFAPF